MFINQQQLNAVLDNYFTMNDAGDFNQQYFDHSMQLILDNHLDLYDAMRDIHTNPLYIAFDALQRFAQEACDNEYNVAQGIGRTMIVMWLTTHFVYSGEAMKNIVAYITNERAEAQKEKEENTMKNTINENTSINITSEDIICSECGEVIIKAGEELDSSLYEVIDGEYVCMDCVEREFVQCQDCGEYVRRDDAYAYEGDYLCQNCYENDYTTCDHCGEIIPIDDVTWIESEEVYICDSCRARYYTQCDHCENYVMDYEINRVWIDSEQYDSEWYCPDCLSDYAWQCEECGEWYSEDVSDNGRCVCDECYSGCSDTGDINTWKSPRKRMPYGFKPVPCMCATEAEKAAEGAGWEHSIIFYGFELEIDRRNKNVDIDETSAEIVEHLPSTYCKTDCSLDLGGSYSGIEIVSHPATLAWYEEHKADFEDCFEMLTDDDWLSHNAGTCGLHVHISLDAMEQKNPFAVNNMLFIFDRFWKQFVKFSRRTEDQLNHWAKRYSTMHDNYKDIKNIAKGKCGRYMAVNLQNRHTVELRMWRGTLKPQTFFATLQLVDTVVKKCIEIGEDYRRLQSLTWAELVHSDHKELNEYLAIRGLNTPEAERDSLQIPDEEDRPENKFNVGDRVRVISSPDGFDALIGREGVVARVNPDRRERLFVAVDFSSVPETEKYDRLHWIVGDIDRGWWCEAESLEVITEPVVTPREEVFLDLPTGTHVRLVGSYIGDLEGMTGIIVDYDTIDGEYAVEFDEENATHFHDCGGRTGEYRGYWCLPEQLEVIGEPDDALFE